MTDMVQVDKDAAKYPFVYYDEASDITPAMIAALDRYEARNRGRIE